MLLPVLQGTCPDMRLGLMRLPDESPGQGDDSSGVSGPQTRSKMSHTGAGSQEETAITPSTFCKRQPQARLPFPVWQPTS